MRAASDAHARGPQARGTWTRWLSPSEANASGSGVRWTEGEVLDILVQRRRDKAAAVKVMRKLLKKQGYAPDVLVTDKLGSYAARHDAS